MYSQSIDAGLSASRRLFTSWTTLSLLTTVYASLLIAAYLFVSVREATVSQLILTLVLMFLAPALFFLLQATSVNYVTGTSSTGLVRQASHDCLKLLVVSVPVIAATLLTLYGLSKLQQHFTIATSTLNDIGQWQPPPVSTGLKILTVVRYLLIGVIVPLLTIQLWIATSNRGLRSLVKSLHRVVAKAFAPQSVFVYGCGFLLFAVVPYFLVSKSIATQHAWLEISVLALRLLLSAILILLGWVLTVGTLSLLNTRGNETRVAQE